MQWTRVLIESPYAGDVERNLAYVRACMRDCILRNEAPYASHALYTQPGVLRDEVVAERELGMSAGWAWLLAVHYVVVYTDLGWSSGMKRGVERARQMGLAVVERHLGSDWSKEKG